jgi:hypothetical protein
MSSYAIRGLSRARTRLVKATAPGQLRPMIETALHAHLAARGAVHEDERGVALPRDSAQQVFHGASVALEAIRPGDLLFFSGETTSGITHVAFAGEGDTLIHSTLACGGVLIEPWLPGTRGGTLRPRLVAVRRLEER